MSDTPTTPTATTTPTTPADRDQFWRDTLAEFACFGQSVRAFGLDRGLHEKRFFAYGVTSA